MDIYVEMAIKIALSIVVGGIIGFEREKNGKPSGLRTMMLVCLGSTVITIVGLEAAKDTMAMVLKNKEVYKDVLKIDTVRLTAQVIAGIGFLGAGTIIQDKNKVRGLTSAATVWVAAIIGIAIGYGYYFLAGVTMVAVLLTLLINFFKKDYS